MADDSTLHGSDIGEEDFDAMMARSEALMSDVESLLGPTDDFDPNEFTAAASDGSPVKQGAGSVAPAALSAPTLSGPTGDATGIPPPVGTFTADGMRTIVVSFEAGPLGLGLVGLTKETADYASAIRDFPPRQNGTPGQAEVYNMRQTDDGLKLKFGMMLTHANNQVRGCRRGPTA